MLPLLQTTLLAQRQLCWRSGCRGRGRMRRFQRSPLPIVVLVTSMADRDVPPLLQATLLARRLQGALPHAPLLGGLLQSRSWGDRSLRGALFLGERTHDAGAVGCILHGPIQARNALSSL